jgi:hypothetical protein
MNATNSTAAMLAFQIQESLVSLIRSENVPEGRLATLKDVRSSSQFSTGKAPACAVMPVGWPDPQPHAQRRLKTVITTEIIMAVRSIITPPAGDQPGRIATEDDALAQMKPLVDDGCGNGIVAILNDRGTFGLGIAGVSESRIGKGEFYPVIKEGDQQSIWLYFSVLYYCTVYPTY